MAASTGADCWMLDTRYWHYRCGFSRDTPTRRQPAL